MLFKTYCATCIGIDAVTVTVEVDLSTGIGLHLVGLPDVAVKESLLRVTTALECCGYRVPGRKIVFNLAPADIRKEGSSYDLSIAIGLIAVSEQAYIPRAGEFIIMGELALDGKIRSVSGALPVAIHAREAGFKGCIFPLESAVEAADIEGLEIYGVSDLSQVIEILSDDIDVSRLLIRRTETKRYSPRRHNDFKDVKGQIVAKRGLEIAAAGAHNLILVGAPGSGKTFMATCLPSILPQMSREESIETSKIYSISGKSTGQYGLLTERPFRTPHHSASLVSLIGGGQNAIPGEISLAHNGVLYLDEIAQFGKIILDSLRQPLEDGKVTISRIKYKVEYPASFMLIASMNPCPCGYYGDDSGRCTCNPQSVMRYMSRLSGPMMDRIDMHIFVKGVTGDELLKDGEEESSAAIAARVVAARNIQMERFKNDGIFVNSGMNSEMIKRYCEIGSQEKLFLKTVIRKLNLSARAYSRILKLARTIADLEGNNFISLRHISEAVQFRNLDRGNIYD
ncbi:MAG: YifB family Mg chelatase-like AAA ATPase [Bacteroidales bacterium]|nr:YifB family Mg chelatase-like AAA ATPase [Bacteroidales bacterium]MDD4671084.1 YifB family Mg chelatase-like AAA ATPase [Bacteroidales bacterium]